MSSSSPEGDTLYTDFYGESTPWPVTDLVYCEQLSLRSGRYDWQIKPHRHQDLIQIFYVESGRGNAQVDGTPVVVVDGDLLVVPEQCVHTFRWEEDSQGFVLFIARPLLKTLERLIGPLPWCHGRAGCFSQGNDAPWIKTLLQTLYQECEGNQPQRELFLENLVMSLFIWLNRQNRRVTALVNPDNNKAKHKLEKFIDLLEEHYQQQHSVQWYADTIGVTAAHLNSLCQQHRQQSALSLIHQRLLAEAQRQLIYTNKTAANIADLLGFADPAYFSRFFKRLTEQTPKAFRHSLPDS